ncbi:MAG: SBBP repeat-containing protein, partial [Acidobacteriota bacterium]
QVLYSTYLGGSNSEDPTGLIVTNSGTVYLSGKTGSTDFPVRNSSQSYGGGSQDAFSVMINP